MRYLAGRQWWFSRLVFALALAAGWLWRGSALATGRDYTIATSQSQITISGTVDALGSSAPIQPQGTGSLAAKYSGTIKTDRTADGIAFLPGSSIDANPTGSWKPLADGSEGSATADYGGKATFFFVIVVNFAGRNFIGGLTSGALPIDGTNHFDLSTATVTFTTGDLAYRNSASGESGFGSVAGGHGALSGSGSISSLMQGAQTTETLMLPVSSMFDIMPDASTTIHLTLSGQLVASSTFATPLPGDYNQNGVVDAADYVLWRDEFGSATSLPNDDTAGVGNDDYTRWRSHFGQVLGSGSGTLSNGAAAVPEASTLMLIGVAAIITHLLNRQRVWR